MERLNKKSHFMWNLRKLKQFEPEFKVAQFATEAHSLYVSAHEALAKVDKETLHTLVSGHEDVKPKSDIRFVNLVLSQLFRFSS